MQSEEVEQQQLARHGADLTPSPRTGAIVDELLHGVVSDTFATGESHEGSPEHIAQSQTHGALLPEAEPQPQPHGALLPEAEPRPQSHGALQGQQPLYVHLYTCGDCSCNGVHPCVVSLVKNHIICPSWFCV